ncbi:MAG TPA: PQQ-dependent sugar dehydrogenase, partial [Flavobacterium sp.]
SKPWSVKMMPDGRLLVTEKAGNFRIVTTAGMIGKEITGIPAVKYGGQGGLLDVLLDPDFETNRMIYWTYSADVGKGNLTAVGKGRLSSNEDKIENAITIYKAEEAFDNTMHYGSRIIFDREGYLVVTTGERSDLKTRPLAQSLNSAIGKVVRITKDGKPAAGNPFLNQQGKRPEIYSYGHRNPQGLALHPVTSDIWVSEMGPQGGDEINLIRPGKNYGWPTITYGEEYSGDVIGSGIGQKEGMEQPVYYWDPVLSPSGMTFYSGNTIPEWQNNLFVCGLNSKHIARLILRDNKVVGEERLLTNEGQRFRDITEGKDGALYAVTDEGRLYRIGK